MMEDIAVEELNRDKKGIRVKALRDHGYNNYADILTARDYDLSAVRGISEDTASPISATQSARYQRCCQCTEPINGSVSPAKRQKIIDGFDKAPAGQVLVAQIVAGGTGLNIQSASVVIICEPQLKPSIESQAISRAYRMGQARNVLVYRLLASNTVDERVTDLLEEKQTVFDAFADKSVAAQKVEVDKKTFGNIIQEEIDRINGERSGKVKA